MENKSNKTIKKKTGDLGEEIAVRDLLRKGYSIVCQNFSCRCGEVDIIAMKDDVIAFVEVRTRSRTDFGLPCETVGKDKQRRLLHSAEYFLKLNRFYSGYQPRMDIFEVIRKQDRYYVRHIENAF